MSVTTDTFVRDDLLPAKAPPRNTVGVVGWLRQNLFSTPLNGVMTIIILAFIVWTVTPFIRFTLIDAVWTGPDRSVCATATGACWAYVKAYLPQFIYGRYPIGERWRVDLVFVLLLIGLIPMLIPRVPYKALNAIFLIGVFPVVAYILLTGGHHQFVGSLIPSSLMAPSPLRFAVQYAVFSAVILGLLALYARLAGRPISRTTTPAAMILGYIAVILVLVSLDFGLVPVETANWGGLLVTLVVAITGMVAAFPLGILLALGRRSNMPVVSLASTIFIEVWRGVPLITVLFMASVMLPLFLPEGVTFDKLLRALIGVTLFQAAYMAETIRGGLQAIPRGQYEGAMALGLGYWQMMRKIILPQALRIVIPGIVGSFISLFKDTTLVIIIGLYDFLGQIQASANDAKWASPVTGLTGYIFAAMVFWAFCFAMSRYAAFTERRLDRGRR
ncbi:amino acid ABC transporter permease [Kaistia granuli]|uniref:amino acid ABC transporter permease n=1 Tax=Kaistia granuli TaxID=363259 RepID=UPI000382A74E|nr:amino acid ABC transporter permease [Kaistia granuli]